MKSCPETSGSGWYEMTPVSDMSYCAARFGKQPVRYAAANGAPSASKNCGS